MSTLGKLLVTILFVGILLWAALCNRTVVDVSLPPFIETMQLPIALVMLVGIILGFIWGAAIVWLNGSTTRTEARHLRRELKTLEKMAAQKDGKSLTAGL